MSNAPTILIGPQPLARAVVRSGTSDTATTITPDDSGSLFVNLSTSVHTYTLPTVSNTAGKTFLFFDGETTADIIITGGTADKIMSSDDSAADYVYTTSATVGDWGMVIGDGTYLYFLEGAGTWEVKT